MITVENFVDPSIVGNPPILINPKILFITENCPNFGFYLYRTLIGNPHPNAGGANNLLNNLCRATGIIAPNEINKLNIFLNVRNYALIDTHQNGIPLNIIAQHPILDICNDIIYLNPEQIVFTCIGSNTAIFHAIYPILPVPLQHKIVYRIDGNPVFNSPSNRAFPGFLAQINEVIENGDLLL